MENRIIKLQGLMAPGNERYFILPETPFIPALIVDYQEKEVVTYEQLEKEFDVIATLDDTYSQSMQTPFVRYYNRIGFPDLDVKYSFGKLV